MIKKLGIIFIALFCGTQFLPAQNDIIVHNEKTGVDEEIDLPEGMVYEIDSLLQDWYSKTYLSPDEDCISSNENPTYNKEEYISRLNRLPNVIEMPYNDVVQKFIDL